MSEPGRRRPPTMMLPLRQRPRPQRTVMPPPPEIPFGGGQRGTDDRGVGDRSIPQTITPAPQHESNRAERRSRRRTTHPAPATQPDQPAPLPSQASAVQPEPAPLEAFRQSQVDFYNRQQAASPNARSTGETPTNTERAVEMESQTDIRRRRIRSALSDIQRGWVIRRTDPQSGIIERYNFRSGEEQTIQIPFPDPLERFNEAPLVGNVIGIAEGVYRTTIGPIIDLMRFITSDQMHRILRSLGEVELDEATLREMAELYVAMNDPRNLVFLAEIAQEIGVDVLLSPLTAIRENYEQAIRETALGRQRGASNQITQLTVNLISLLSLIGAARTILVRMGPRFSGRLRNLISRLQQRLQQVRIRNQELQAQELADIASLRREQGLPTLEEIRRRSQEGSITIPGRSTRTPVPHHLPNGTPIHPNLRARFQWYIDRGIDVTDPYTLRHFNEIHSRWSRPEMLARANLGEYQTILRYAEQPDIERLRFLEPTNVAGDRTPDIQILRRGQSVAEHVEVRTLTQTRRGYRGSPRDQIALFISDSSIEEKIFHGQISQSHPGSMVFQAPYSQMNQHWLPTWQGLFNDIRRRRAFPPGLRRIEVATTRHLLVFEPPAWQGRLISIGR